MLNNGQAAKAVPHIHIPGSRGFVAVELIVRSSDAIMYPN